MNSRFWRHWEPHIYRTAPGFWGLGISHSASHWCIQAGPWVLTTEPGDSPRWQLRRKTR